MERKGIPPPDLTRKGRGEKVFAITLSGLSVVVSAIARFNDARAFEAIATPALAFCLILSALCAVGVSVVVRARREGFVVPAYFRWVLLGGSACGVLAVILVALPVLTKDEAKEVAPIHGERLDLRNQLIRDRSFAGSNLRGSNLSGAVLEHVDLSGADLSESDLRNVTLNDVDLSEATLCGVDLRGADLRGARGLETVTDWSYVFYSTQRTRLPGQESFVLEALPGPMPDTGRDLLYMCGGNVTKRIEAGS